MRISLRSAGFVLLAVSFVLVSLQLAHDHRPSLSLPASTSASTVRAGSAGKTRQLARLEPANKAAKAAKATAKATTKAAMATAGTSVAAGARNRSVTLRGWIKDVAYKSLPSRWHGHDLTTLDLDASLPRPFDADFDARWVPWLHRAKLTKVKLVRKTHVKNNNEVRTDKGLNSMWTFTLATAGVDAAAAEAVFGSSPVQGAQGIFRPLISWQERKHVTTGGMCGIRLKSGSSGGMAFEAEAAKELLAFRLERLLGLYRAPPIVFRCFNVDSELRGVADCTEERCLNNRKPKETALESMLADLAPHHPGPVRHVCGSLALRVEGATQLCPRLQTGFCPSCGGDKDGKAGTVLRELADLALYDTLLENDDREPNLGAWQAHSGMFDACPACTTAKGEEEAIEVHNLHCLGPTGGLLFVDQGSSFTKTQGHSVPLISDSGSKVDITGLGLCVADSTREAVLAVGDTVAFQRRFGALVAELEAEIVGALYPGKIGSPPAHCRFDRNVVSRVSATFERVRGHVLNCTSDIPRWYRALAQERKERRKRSRERKKKRERERERRRREREEAATS